MRHGCAMGIRVGDKRVAAIERNVEPLVSVGGPGIGSFDSGDEMFVARACGGPETEGSVDVNPGVIFFRERNESFEIVHRADVYVAGLQENDCGSGRILF